ncbi:MAG: hypothetical protein A2029_06845 [Chloroflexi bacterium RBG_19FT_COMBO_47_9]|nr:MAG: hypothetical protein A2029_06845 [Chloroflexi bacterium RBG_19FT_COMBO_47_9]
MTELTIPQIIFGFLFWIVLEIIIALFLRVLFRKLNEYWIAYISAGIVSVIVAVFSKTPSLSKFLITLLLGTFLMGTIFWVCWLLIRLIFKKKQTDQLPDQQGEQ